MRGIGQDGDLRPSTCCQVPAPPVIDPRQVTLPWIRTSTLVSWNM
jgi:hypothetical protein